MHQPILGADHPRPDRERSKTDSMSGEEPTLIIYHPITGEALDPDSIQYKAMYQFLNNDAPDPSGAPQFPTTNPQEPPPFSERQRRPSADHIPEEVHQGQLGNPPLDTNHQG